MSAPMTPAQFKRQMDKWGVKINYVDGWDSPNSGRDDETGLAFGPVFGGVQHHTGDDAPDSLDRRVIADGRSDLPGPLAQGGLNDDGTIDVFTCHRANHAGGGDARVLDAVKNESYDKYPPKSRYHTGSSGATDGNDAFYGLEAYYSGSHKLTDAAYESMILWWSAIFDFYGWSAKSLIGHKEWSDWKSDPGSYDMHEIRLDLQQSLDDGPPSQRKPDVAPAPNEPTNKIIDARKAITQAIDLLDSANRKNPVVSDVADNLRKQRRRLPKS